MLNLKNFYSSRLLYFPILLTTLLKFFIHYLLIQLKLHNLSAHNPIFREFSILSLSKLSSEEFLTSRLSRLSREDVFLLSSLILSPDSPHCLTDDTSYEEHNYNFKLYVLKDYFLPSTMSLKEIKYRPLYPIESRIFDSYLDSNTSDKIQKSIFQSPLAIPKLNMQFLTMHDYLLRNFDLYFFESTYQIKLDIEDSIRYLDPQIVDDSAGYGQPTGEIVFSGWSRMACPIKDLEITQISRPKVGDHFPSSVHASINLDLEQFTNNIRSEWESSVKPLDVLFLISVRAPKNDSNSNPSKYSVVVRGCQIDALIGKDGRPLDDYEKYSSQDNNLPDFKVDSFRVSLDPIQYQNDVTSGLESIYSTFNIILRRKSKENNFKSVLSTIRNLIEYDISVPKWFRNIFLGFGDPKSSSSKVDLNNLSGSMEFYDTFIDIEHVISTFPYATITTEKGFSPCRKNQSFILNFINDSSVDDSKISNKVIEVSLKELPIAGPYPSNVPLRNQIRFTPTQIQAIASAQKDGLTLIVGPPGTGKTDVAVQIISNLYHCYPSQRILLITHSNQALNQLFDKILSLDIDQRHLLRLGHGEEDLNSLETFTKVGRVDSFLLRRSYLLEKVSKLAEGLGVTGDVGYTCETANYFFISQILTRWNIFVSNIESHKHESVNHLDSFTKLFPFGIFFSDAPKPLFTEDMTFQNLFEVSMGCFRYIKSIFDELNSMRPFELLRSSYDRSNYLLLHEAKIVAMTCTHAALKRSEFARLGFDYDSVIIEEAAQILEIESLIPLVLNSNTKDSKLKRVIMIGDHNQLPPVVKNDLLKNSCNMEQSMFTRLIRLGVPTIGLDMQGRSRPNIANLFRWAYHKLGDLEKISVNPEYKTSNSGFAYNYQAIDVNTTSGKGESEPNPHFYQNLGEAEYAVAIYQYMRLIGYPKESICVLTTYNGQRSLLMDVFNLRCGSVEAFGVPKISTVDQYQGMQSDYVILSLVRTKHVGHIRDYRRLIVAMSRARLGLYILCHYSLFKECPEIKPVFELLGKRSLLLRTVEDEHFPTDRDIEFVEKTDSSNIREFGDLIEFGNYVFEKANSYLS
ncbi:Intron-binding protein aquarius [Smittium mucronatum]|uniref:Intron-binding protein aquarius n=1 Tax=Smittium mucronatum TaxID=133383 RepID=A0A1R0GNX9_9FUNG|nr:Intron-binding protein aquarius [Smittium mucronatum]